VHTNGINEEESRGAALGGVFSAGIIKSTSSAVVWLIYVNFILVASIITKISDVEQA